MEFRNSLPIDVTKSVKLEQYYNQQNLEPEDTKFLEDVDISRLFDDSTYNSIKYKTETYHKIKNNISDNVYDMAQVEEELKSLRDDVLYETNGEDIEKIDLSKLQSSEKLDSLLRDCGASSKNDIRVRIMDIDENWGNNGEFKKVELVSSNEPWSYGILPSAKILVLSNGTIITKTNSLYRK